MEIACAQLIFFRCPMNCMEWHVCLLMARGIKLTDLKCIKGGAEYGKKERRQWQKCVCH